MPYRIIKKFLSADEISQLLHTSNIHNDWNNNCRIYNAESINSDVQQNRVVDLSAYTDDPINLLSLRLVRAVNQYKHELIPNCGKNEYYELESIPQFVRYKEKGFFKKHRDYVPEYCGPYNRISFSLLISQANIGGQFNLNHHENALKDEGDLIMFSSDEDHSISQIQSGCRLAITGFLRCIIESDNIVPTMHLKQFVRLVPKKPGLLINTIDTNTAIVYFDPPKSNITNLTKGYVIRYGQKYFDTEITINSGGFAIIYINNLRSGSYNIKAAGHNVAGIGAWAYEVFHI